MTCSKLVADGADVEELGPKTLATNPCPNDQMAARKKTTQTVAEFSSAELVACFEAASRRSMNIADAAAAAMLHTSPILNPTEFPSNASSAVPKKAVNADIHVATEISLPKRIRAKNGTNLTFW